MHQSKITYKNKNLSQQNIKNSHFNWKTRDPRLKRKKRKSKESQTSKPKWSSLELPAANGLATGALFGGGVAAVGAGGVLVGHWRAEMKMIRFVTEPWIDKNWKLEDWIDKTKS